MIKGRESQLISYLIFISKKPCLSIYLLTQKATLVIANTSLSSRTRSLIIHKDVFLQI